MLNWLKRGPDAKDTLIESLRGEIAYLRNRHDIDAQRVDRLMEALARKANVDLIMPLPPPQPIERVSVPNPWKDPNQVTTQFKEKTQ
jgi:hypothetical protein